MKKVILAIIFILILFGLVFVVVKKNSKEISNSSKLSVTASFYPMYFFTNEIGGDKVEVTNITPAGAEPHDYELTPRDTIKIQQSKLLVINGLVEPWAERLKNNLLGKDIQIVTAGQNLTTGQIKKDGILQADPHVWLSPKLAERQSQKITEALQNIDPINASYYENNFINFKNELDKIDENYKTGLANCQQRSFITSHAAFGYLAKDYGLTQIAIDGLSPEAEPSLLQLAQIADFAKKNNVKVIFFEALASPKLSETIANEVGAKTLVLDPIEGVSHDDLLKGVNYLTLMANNLQNLRIALNCE